VDSLNSVFFNRLNRLEIELQKEQESRLNISSINPYSLSCTTNVSEVSDQKPACFSLEVKNSIFKNFNYGMTPSKSPIYVDGDNGMQYQGKILQLRGFQGNVSILNNTFDSNNLAINDCEVYGIGKSEFNIYP
jgi:hypothetical protein